MPRLKELRPAEFFEWIHMFGFRAYADKHVTLLHAAHLYAAKTNESLSLPLTPSHTDIAAAVRVLCMKLHLPFSSDVRLGRLLAKECGRIGLPIVGG